MKKLSFLFAALVTALTMSATEVAVSIADYATDNAWENSKQYTLLVMDEAVSVTAEGGSNTGKYSEKHGRATELNILHLCLLYKLLCV